VRNRVGRLVAGVVLCPAGRAAKRMGKAWRHTYYYVAPPQRGALWAF
jgi:hypothetical protein